MTPQQLEQFCDDWLTAWTGNQPEKLLSFYTDGAFYRDPHLKGGGVGKEVLRPYFTKLLKYNPNWVWRRQQLWPVENGFVLKWQANIPLPSGETLVEQGMDHVELRDGKIDRNEVYFDRSAWMEAIK